jgi:hypothetical protein
MLGGGSATLTRRQNKNLCEELGDAYFRRGRLHSLAMHSCAWFSSVQIISTVIKCPVNGTVEVVPVDDVEVYGGSRVIAPFILSFGDRWKWVVNTAPLPLLPSGKNPDAHSTGGWVGSTVDLDVLVVRQLLYWPTYSSSQICQIKHPTSTCL